MMELKDLLPVIVALIAVVVSVVALVVSTRKQETEDERSLRSLLSETVRQINASRIEQAKAALQAGFNPQSFQASQLNSLFSYEINSLARLAVYAMEKIPNLVADIEYTAVADAFAWTGD